MTNFRAIAASLALPTGAYVGARGARLAMARPLPRMIRLTGA